MTQHPNLPLDLAVRLQNMATLHKIAMLAELTKWADSEEGRDMRAAMAHCGGESPVTAEDVLALLPEKVANDTRDNLGMWPEYNTNTL